MKIYIGNRVEPHGCEVSVRTPDGKEYPLPLRLEVRNHSPTGFEWGYAGSGPAQLALAILCDHFGPVTPPIECPYCGSRMDGPKCTAPKRDCSFDWDRSDEKWEEAIIFPGTRNYQDFKFEVVAKLPSSGWELTSEAVDAWVAKGASK